MYWVSEELHKLFEIVII